MKKKLFIILFIFLLWGIGGFAQSSSVTVTPITANYTANPPTVTFKVSWDAGTRDAVTHRSKVWLLVDYRRIINNAYTGGWLRAGISSAHTPIATAGSTVSIEPNNTKGFWLQGTDGAFAATVTVPVTVDLTGYDYKFAWCGVASDRPPYAEEKTGSYTLHGTPPFIIQTHPADASQTVTEHTTAYNDCIYALTDATGAPGDTPLPAITDFTASATTICKGGSVTLTASATNAASYSFNDGAWSSSSTTVVSPTSATTYTLKVQSAGGCMVPATTTVTITVNDPPVPQSLTADPLTVCAGESATLTASADNAASYSLNGSTWTASEQLTDYPMTTTTYTLYIKSAAGCTASLENAATVTVNDTPVVASVAASTPCATSSATLTATVSSGASTAMTYTWIVGSTQSTTTVNTITTQTLNSNTAFTVTVTNAYGCTSAAYTGEITITSPGANGQSATCGCLSGLVNCSGTCRTNTNYPTNDGVCSGTCKYAYVQLRSACGAVIDPEYSIYYEGSCLAVTKAVSNPNAKCFYRRSDGTQSEAACQSMCTQGCWKYYYWHPDSGCEGDQTRCSCSDE